MKLDKVKLDIVCTILGFVSGFSLVLMADRVINPKIGLIISGTSLIFLGYFAQRPADKRPTTYDIEEREVDI